MKVLLLDNYDSFTFNLLHLVEKLIDCQVDVKRNDEIELDEFEAYDRIILSPGPGLPIDAGIMPAFIKTYYKSKNILGVCLGHQAIAEFFGASLNKAILPRHGKVDLIIHNANIHVMDDAGSVHEAMAIRDGKVIEVEGKAKSTVEATFIDLQNDEIPFDKTTFASAVKKAIEKIIK